MSGPVTAHVLVVETTGLGDRSYVVHDGRYAFVVDPQRDIDRVEQLLAEHGLQLHTVFETHVHNDYVSGGLELARIHGARYVVPSASGVAFEHVPAGDGDRFEVGAMIVTALHTPGHTPHHTSYVVMNGDRPGAAFNGGSMLFGAVGRPDLIGPDDTVALAHAQWHSVRRLADDLPSVTDVHPTHGFGSFCAATQFEGDSGTVADELVSNPALTQEEAPFVASTLASLDVFPAYYVHMGPTNAAGPWPVDLFLPEPVGPDRIAAALGAGEWVIDLRSRERYSSGHLPVTLSFDVDGPFIAYLSWLIPRGAPLILLGDTTEQVRLAQRELVRVGIDGLAGQAVGGPQFWTHEPDQLVAMERITFSELGAKLSASDGWLLDVRQVLEWEAGHIDGARHIPFYEVADRLDEIPRDRVVHVYCASGYRAASIGSMLQGFGHRIVLVDDDWVNAASAGLTIVTEVAPHREPGWTWRVSRASARVWADALTARS
jgi:hydroxyacylglutathione hydrolase